MAITDELRLFAADPYTGWVPTDKQQADLRAIADRIDERHERALRESYDCGYASADDWLAQHEDAMADHGWVRLPLDADGEPIRVGDELDGLHYEDGTVTGIQYGLAANGTISELVAVRPHGWDTATWHDPEEYRHYHAPTVEDVLREFADAMSNTNPLGVPARIAEYAAKLRLAEEVDE